MIRRSWRYLAGHWQGSHGLGWSFWVNFVFVRVSLFLLQDWLSPEVGYDYHDYRIAVLAVAFFFHGVLFVWQAVGVVRASEAHIRSAGSMAPVWGAQLAFIIAFFWVLFYLLQAWTMTVPVPEKFGNLYEAERRSKYRIVPSSDGLSLTLTGSLELGATDLLEERLVEFPNVEQIFLESSGGNIYAARGLANIISEEGLNTLVANECSSACTTVFIGGDSRYLAVDARLGFHQYRISADYAVLNADLLFEQERDRAIFLRAGVQSWFIEKMFVSSASEMWYPEFSELLDANVVTGIAP